MNRCATFEARSMDDLSYWIREDKRIAQKIIDLIQHIQRDPFQGIGKPEPLKGNLAGCWSRRINDEHRLVYRVTDAAIEIVQCRGHY